ncbi:hypothetical protein ACFLZC_02725 [Patescibacteria group bacterium]
MTYIYLIIAGVLGYFFGKKFAKSSKAKSFADASKNELKEVRKKADKALNERTEDRKEKILEAMKDAREDFKMGCNLREGENEEGITREEVEKLLDVSSGTANKYLNDLEKNQKIKQIGSSGRGVYYILAK